MFGSVHYILQRGRVSDPISCRQDYRKEELLGCFSWNPAKGCGRVQTGVTDGAPPGQPLCRVSRWWRAESHLLQTERPDVSALWCLISQTLLFLVFSSHVSVLHCIYVSLCGPCRGRCDVTLLARWTQLLALRLRCKHEAHWEFGRTSVLMKHTNYNQSVWLKHRRLAFREPRLEAWYVCVEPMAHLKYGAEEQHLAFDQIGSVYCYYKVVWQQNLLGGDKRHIDKPKPIWKREFCLD